MSLWRNLALTLEMIKWEHSIFALPFALTGAMLAAGGWPPFVKIAWIVVCMVTARTAAMAFNRWADAKIDAENPRTSMRAIPAGLISRRFVLIFWLASSALFLLAAAQLNRLTLLLAPVALAVVLLYSYTKRFTRFSHLFLGLALGIAPAAAWIAVRGHLDLRILMLMVAVLFWTGGFDVLYACQDYEFDISHGLHSIPQSLGLRGAFMVARAMHVLMLMCLMLLVRSFSLGPVAWLGLLLVAGLLLYEHLLVSPTDLQRMNAAFFTLNGVISVLFFVSIATSLLIHHHPPSK